ncbi:MAG: hypothetical protein A3J63_02810 [Candidatus Moranbacteria bacterium RIFCSPHIGHO2_02_FULL_40_12b]|nr:MAG: hypothetical protein A3J63_02810 [Candidatus Moranbacteria bacterium RIFCSPHIGHO2_02_FULL_40_12b]
MPSREKITVIVEKRTDAINKYSESIILNLKKGGVAVRVILLDNKPFKNSLINFISEIINTIKATCMIRHDDIVLFTDPLSFNLLGSIIIPNKKFVIFYHYEQDPFYYKYLPFISYQNVLNKLDGIICISNFSLSQLASLGVDTKKCKVVYGGLDHDLFTPSKKKLYLFDYILSVGSEEPRKNMENILASFQILKKDFPNLKLLKIGRVNPTNRKQTLCYIEKLQLTDSVVFTDYIDEKKLPQIYSGAKLLLFPSLLEGFGIPIAEAMACGCPVVTSNRDPMKELIGLSQTTVNPLDPIEMALECKKIILDEKYRDTAIKNSLERAKYFDWGSAAVDVYNLMIKD